MPVGPDDIQASLHQQDSVRHPPPRPLHVTEVRFHLLFSILILLTIVSNFSYTARIDDGDPGHEHDSWMNEKNQQRKSKKYEQIVGITRIWMYYQVFAAPHSP